MRHQLTFVTSAILLALACASPTSPSAATTTTTTTGTGSAPAWYAKFGTAVTVSTEGTNVVLRSTGVPDHASPYWGTGHALYEAPHAGMQINPNRIATQSIVMRVPMTPTRATASDTPMGVMYGVNIGCLDDVPEATLAEIPITCVDGLHDRFEPPEYTAHL